MRTTQTTAAPRPNTEPMPTPSHTPGPWTLDGSIMAKLEGREVQITCISPTRWCGNMTAEEKRLQAIFSAQEPANARLMASAPELLFELRASMPLAAPRKRQFVTLCRSDWLPGPSNVNSFWQVGDTPGVVMMSASKNNRSTKKSALWTSRTAHMITPAL